MIRPCFLVVDREYAGSISTRKLVIETAKLNVITAYSGSEAIETLKKFPNIDGAVVDADIKDIPVQELIMGLKDICPKIPVVLVGIPNSAADRLADHELERFDPSLLLALLKRIAPEKSRAVEEADENLRPERLEGQ